MHLALPDANDSEEHAPGLTVVASTTLFNDDKTARVDCARLEGRAKTVGLEMLINCAADDQAPGARTVQRQAADRLQVRRLRQGGR